MIRHRLALAGAAIVLVVVPWQVLRRPGAAVRPLPVPDVRPLVPGPLVPIEGVLTRAPFGGGEAAEPAEEPQDASAPPQIAGIAGRLPDRAIVLVRRPGGGTQPLAIGGMAGRWRLLAIAPDAALFGDGQARVRVELPPADPAQ